MRKYAAALLVLGCCVALSAEAQNYCGGAVDGVIGCTIPAGTVTFPLSITSVDGHDTYSVESDATFNVVNEPYALRLQSLAAVDNGGSSLFGVTINGAMTLDNTSGNTGGGALPGDVFQYVSTGASGSDGQAGGWANSVQLFVNAASITAQGSGVDAIQLIQTGGNGGAGANDATAPAGGTVSTQDRTSLTLDGATVSSSGADAIVFSFTGGAGGQAGQGDNPGNDDNSRSTGGLGGAVNNATNVAIEASTVTAYGRGLVIEQTGGAGGDGHNGDESENQWSDAGNGAYGGDIDLQFIPFTNGDGTNSGSTIATAGQPDNAPAVLLSSTGGAGGSTFAAGGGLAVDTDAGSGGSGGAGGKIAITSSGPLAITTEGDSSPGIDAMSLGAAGGSAGEVECLETCTPGGGGHGGAGLGVSVSLGAGASITTTGDTAAAITALSHGGTGGAAGGLDDATGVETSTGAPSGDGGPSGLVSIALTGDELVTHGTESPGLVVQSVGGLGGTTTAQISKPLGSAVGSKGGDGGDSGGASVSTDPSNAITTTGDASPGVIVQVLSGPGGAGGQADGNLSSTGGAGGDSGTIADATVTNQGTIATSGAGSQGIIVQSIAGGGGVGGSSYGLFSTNGGDANLANANAGAVTITDGSGAAGSGEISTGGDVAAAILAQSIGGGGGDGGSSSGVFYSQGGEAGAGGDGGTVNVNIEPNAVLESEGVLSHGILAQSIGGSGGSGGNATAANALASYVVGGSAGPGGDGGTIAVNADGGQFELHGSGSAGILAQSIGGGGGAGGAAYAIDVGNSVAVAAAIGGTGGDGGSGGNVTIATTDTTIDTGHWTAGNSGIAALPVDAIGILAQSISGGGGAGGGASAEAFAVGMPSNKDPDSPGVALTITHAVGGTGGGGGDASHSTVQALLNDGTNIETAGAGSIGVLAQAIGGGGGQGGDASTLNAAIGSANKYFTSSAGTTKVNISLANGATGGSGGGGGAVSVTLGNAAGGSAGIATTGDYADGLLVQSIGGGGGNAGFGSSDMHATGKGATYTLKVDLGAQGGVGGAGGPATVNLDPESTIATLGSGAIGVLAQSIGGGGGNSTGGTVNLGGLAKKVGNKGAASHVKISFSPTIGLGAPGGSGGDGGSVAATSTGSITTIADDAPGLLLQSIGGGGGVGGSPGQDAAPSGDRTESLGDAASAAEAEGDEPGLKPGAVTFQANATLSFGGRGGVAGDGGAVSFTEQGTVRTSGDYSPGAVAQSIGGGGGRGGSAIVGTQDNSVQSIIAKLKIQTNISLGINGTGGGGGHGGAVTATLNGATIATGVAGEGSSGTGFQSIGLFAQSIGGGGGMAADGTLSPNGMAAIGAGTDGANGNGGTVTIQQTSGSVNTISTAGDYAIGVVAQSVGGGGGIYGAGASTTVPDLLYSGGDCTNPGSTAMHIGTICLKLGAHAAADVGDGGEVKIPYPDLDITTTGNGAFGVLAQSIGAGGGLAAVGGNATVQQLGATDGGTGNASSVTVELSSAGSIMTSGVEAHGVVAQSIGGGGGVAVFATPGTTPSLTTATPPIHDSAEGAGGDVSVETHAPITVSGAGAFDILAQSIGGGGGLETLDNGTVYAGTTNGGNAHSNAGSVSVTTQGSIVASGENGVAVFAQASAPTNSVAGAVTIELQGGDTPGKVQGGSGSQGYGVWVDGGNEDNLLTVALGATLSALSGNAVNYTGGFALDTNNNGVVSGARFDLGGGTFTNNGSLVIAGPTAVTHYYGAATLHGNLVQTASGEIHTDVDFAARRAGHLVVTGDAALAGAIVPDAVSVLPDVDLPVLSIDGAVTGTIEGGHSTLFAYDVHRDQPSTVSLSARATGFAPLGFHIHGAAAELAAYLLPVFNTATTAELGTLFATLGNLADTDPPGYADALDQLSPGIALAFASRARRKTLDFGDALSRRCRDAGATHAVATGNGCVWMEASGGDANQDGADGYAGFSDHTFNLRVGGAKTLAPGWTLGGALGYAHTSLDGTHDSSGTGDAGYAGLSLTRAWRGWRLTGAVLGSFSSNDTHRPISIPGFESTLNEEPDVDTGAALVRADYTFDLGRAYIRPALAVAVVRVHADSFTARGQSTIGLDYGSSSTTSTVVEPDVEFGLRSAFQNGMALDSYVTLGASIPSNSSFGQPVRLLGAAPDAGSYVASIPTDDNAAEVEVGVDLFTAPNLDFRLAWHGAFADHLSENSGMLVGTMHF